MVSDETGKGDEKPTQNNGNQTESQGETILRAKEDNKPKNDRGYSTGANTVEKITALFALIAAVASAASAYYASEQNGIATKALLASQRPWISAEQISLAKDFVFDKSGGNIAVTYVLKNVGNTVATQVEMQAELIPHVLLALVSDDPPYEGSIIVNTDLQATAFCKPLAEESDKLWSENREWGESIFPNNPLTGFVNATMDASEITQAMKDGPPESKQHPGFFGIFNMCVTYRSPFDSRAHQTGYTFLVGSTDQMYKAFIDPKGSRIPKSALHFTKFPGASGFAN